MDTDLKHKQSFHHKKSSKKDCLCFKSVSIQYPCLNNTNITKKKLQKFLIMKFVTLFIHQPLMIVT
jgi:hypothetical protein